ncbi:hypothetical protein VP01_4660g1, partial [Puccinia sorghi]
TQSHPQVLKLCDIQLQTWSWWKEKIINKWGRPAWKYKVKNRFDESIFDIEKDSPNMLLKAKPERHNLKRLSTSWKILQQGLKLNVNTKKECEPSGCKRRKFRTNEESVHEFENDSSLSEMLNNIIQVDLDIADVVFDNHLPQEWKSGQSVTNITESRMIKTKPVRVKGYTAGKSNLTVAIFNHCQP